MNTFDPRLWVADHVSETERQVRDFANNRGFEMCAGCGWHDEEEYSTYWMGWQDDAAVHYCKELSEKEFFGDSFSFPEPIEDVLLMGVGVVTSAVFLKARDPGWEENAALQIRYLKDIRGLSEEEKESHQRRHVELLDRNRKHARDEESAAYQTSVESRLSTLEDTDLIKHDQIPILAVRVQELRRHLIWIADLLRNNYEIGLKNWLKVVYALTSESSEPEARAEYSNLLKGIVQGADPSLLMAWGDSLLVDQFKLPLPVAHAQASGLAFGLASRELHLRRATAVRDKLETLEVLLQFAVADVPPLSKGALKALKEARREREGDTEPKEKTTFSKRDRFAPYSEELATLYDEVYDSYSSDAKRYSEVAKRFGDRYGTLFFDMYGSEECAYPSDTKVRNVVEKRPSHSV